MPESLASTVEQRVHALVAQHRDELEQLVDQALEAELARLVEERIAARNGSGPPATRARVEDANGSRPATKTCTRCGETKPSSEYEQHRSKCRACRRREERERAAARRDREPPVAEPRPAALTAAELCDRGGNVIRADELERWLLAEGLATNGDGRMHPTRRASELAGALAFLG